MSRVSAEKRNQYLQSNRAQILNAANALFKLNGFAGTNVADIARNAGIAKGTLYIYFRSKEDIISAILSEQTLIPLLENMSLDGNISFDTALTTIARLSIDNIHQCLPVLKLAIEEAHRFPACAEQVYRDIINNPSNVLAAYLTNQEHAGMIRRLEHPYLAAQAFLAMITTYVLTQELLGGEHEDPIDLDTWVHEVVQMFFHGVMRADRA